MEKYKSEREGSPEKETAQSFIEEVMKEGARKLFQMAIKNEIEEFLIEN